LHDYYYGGLDDGVRGKGRGAVLVVVTVVGIAFLLAFLSSGKDRGEKMIKSIIPNPTSTCPHLLMQKSLYILKSRYGRLKKAHNTISYLVVMTRPHPIPIPSHTEGKRLSSLAQQPSPAP